MKLKGRGVLITGASRGLGREIAKACVEEGSNVFLCARNSIALQETVQVLKERAIYGQFVFGQVADVSQPEEVNQLVQSAARSLPRLDGLVNNAGVYGPKGPLQDCDWAAWKDTVSINLLGTALLCSTVLPLFYQQRYGKIINLSGGGATAPLPRFSAYAASKAAVVRLTETLAEESRGSGVDINSIAPGALNTQMLNEVLAAGPEKVGNDFYQRAIQQNEQGGIPLEKGAALCVFLLSAASDGITGRLLSAVWDQWEHLPERRALLDGTDIYTLRRIVPGDRGLDWH